VSGRDPASRLQQQPGGAGAAAGDHLGLQQHPGLRRLLFIGGNKKEQGQLLTLRSQSKGRSEEEERREKTKMKLYTQSAITETSPKQPPLQKAESMEIPKDNYVPIGFNPNSTGQFSQNKELYPRVLDGFGQGQMAQTYQSKPPINTVKTQFVDVSSENLKDK
jgi:hypothetical protein